MANNYRFFKIFITIFIPLLVLSSTVELSSSPPRKRSTKSKRERTKAKAIETIRQSHSVSKIAGVEPLIADTIIDDTPNVVCEFSEMGEETKELQMEEDLSVDIETFKVLWMSYISNDEDDMFTAGGLNKTEIMKNIMEWFGTPYRFGGNTERAIDCSAFTRAIFRNNNIELPRTAREQIKVGKPITRDNLEFGDMIFFYTYTRRFASHVGIYLGDNLFAHASSRHGVTVGRLDKPYYTARFIEGRRLTVSDVINLSDSEIMEEPLEY